MAPLTQPAHYGTPIYAVALGCDLKFSKDICYADSNLNIKSPTLTPIGLGCQVCERQNCQHHALTHILGHHKLEQTKNICHLTKG